LEVLIDVPHAPAAFGDHEFLASDILIQSLVEYRVDAPEELVHCLEVGDQAAECIAVVDSLDSRRVVTRQIELSLCRTRQKSAEQVDAMATVDD